MSVYDSEYSRRARGERDAGCTCEVTREARMYGYNGPEPAEWEQNPDCPLHGCDDEPPFRAYAPWEARVARTVLAEPDLSRFDATDLAELRAAAAALDTP